ncbi:MULTISPECIES: dihydrolipoamide acetyltransferase family protein [Acetobacter]|uniref:Dihydrolipoamide acetyltransferase component of pyruvate dehydrogenase complex n=2 Tax=Acetobacter TaxID=434 RepID=A0A511XQR6_9PROT|nr:MULTISPECIES: dihydrolipoamide acetyltransferase family protein [Acetobacter]MBB3884847.1 pyruvate dehydrogenase E2 component (dihydrolipoamide acetyltransferase) [Acetobacter oeni]MCG4255154.1 2-oxo acid dehydrogenase subunit E2 [Acetobacter senegalensis]MCP1247095.1 2-oxo acid dehydrogenase subunit E2 [Acetobacter cerevisiae]MCP1256648.1 2-oxo acid dehydrogenase subunit E2 [Acetobacter cerevisiae]NHO20792.1 pyruvate dehydrogenase complex dihydrolipoamide acetyltransferase [Acetobacter oen
MAVNIFMPDLSASSGTVTLARWLRAEGDAISAGDILAEMEADKATIEIEAPADGILGRILVPDGTQGVCADQVVGIVVRSDEKIPDISGMDVRTVPNPAQETVAEVPLPVREEKARAPVVSGRETRARIFASPVARRLARLHEVDLKQVDGSGPQGRILRRDIDRLLSGSKTVAQETEKPKDEGDRVAMSGMRRVIAERLTKAKQTIPHFYVSVDVQVDALLTLRDELNHVAPAPPSPDTFHLSVNDMLIRAASAAFVAVPSMNVMYSADALVFPRQVDIAVAVSVPDGLLVPVLRDAGRKSLATTSREVRALIERARAGKLRADEMQGGCFTISNVGMFGVDTVTPIINPPHAAILGIGAISRRPVVREEQFAIASLMTCTLCVDHRVVDGALAAQWLGTFRNIVEQPIRLLT